MRCRIGLVVGIVLLTACAAFAADGLVIGNIKIVGNEKTDPRVILTEMWITKGDPYSKEAVAEARQNVMNLRYFQSVEIAEEVNEAAGVVNLTVTVKERMTWGAVPIVGLDGDDADNNEYGARFNENNLLGLGKGISLRYSFTELTTSAAMSYSDPQLFYTHFYGGVGLYSMVHDEFLYDNETVGGYISVGYRPTYETAVTLQFSLREDDYSDVHILLAPLPESFTGQTTKVALGLSYNDVDYHIDSVSDVGASLVVEKGVETAGGDYEFTKSTLGLSYSTTTIGDQWLRLRLSGGAGDDLDTVPVNQELFAIGGGSSLRGYAPSYKIGDRFVTASAQYEIPFWYPAMFGFTGTVSAVGFVDCGNAWMADGGDDSDYVTGIGAGVRAYVNELQAFTFALDLGYGVEEEEFQPHLSFGRFILRH